MHIPKHKRTPILKLLIAAVLVGLLGIGLKSQSSVQAATGINEQINYQGRLLTSTGAVVPDGTYNMEFEIIQDGDGCNPTSGTPPCGGTVEWTETRTGADKVTVKNGYFSVYLGSVTPFSSSVDWNQDTLWLSVNIGGTGSPSWDGEMEPFNRLSSSPYALNSKALGGLTANDFVKLAQGSQTDASLVSSIFINKTGASGNILELENNGSDVLLLNNTGAVTFQNTVDSTTGFQVLDADGGTSILTIDTTNEFVGIGGTPTQIFDVNSPTSNTIRLRVGTALTANPYNLGTNSGSQIVLSSETGTYRQALVFADTPGSSETVFGIASSSNSGSNWTPLFKIAHSGLTTFQNATDSTGGFVINDADGGTPILNIDTTNERVGIGTASPSNTLSVNGTADFQGHVAVGSGATVNGALTVVDSLIGVSSHSTILSVYETTTTTGSASVGYDGLLVNNILNPSGTASYGQVNGLNGFLTVASGNAQNISTGGGTNGFNGGVIHAGSGTISGNTSGVNGAVVNSGGGTLDITNGVNATIVQTSGTINAARGINIATPINFGTITDNYGLYINDQSGVGASDSYNIYSAGASSQNYFEGAIIAGSADTVLTLSTGKIDGDALTLIAAADGGAGTSSGSGLTIRSDGVGLLQGCSDAQVLAWVESTDTWDCSTPSGGGANTALSNIASTNLSAALNVTSGNLNLTTTTSGNIVLNSAGTIELQDNTTITGTLSVQGTTASIGVNDTTGGFLDIFGNGTGTAEGGEARLYLAADYDTSFSSLVFDAYEDDLRIHNGSSVLLTLQGDSGNADFLGTLTAGSADTVLTLSTGKIDGDALTLIAAADGGAGTSSGSGLTIRSDGVGLLQGCSDGQVLAWVESTDTWDCTTGGGGGANTALSNLSAVAINTSLLPASDDAIDLGDNTHRWRDLYLGGDTLHIGTSTSDEGTLSYNTTTNVLHFGTDSTTNGDIAFFTDDLYLDKSTGFVGVGDATPNARLEINNVGSDTNPLVVNTNGSAGNYTPTNSGIFIKDASGNELLRIFASDPDPTFANYNTWNLYIGHEAGLSNPTANAPGSGYANTGLGYDALRANTYGSYNVAVGIKALTLNTVGDGVTAVGAYALAANTLGDSNSAFGYAALEENTTGEYNTAVGYDALNANITGDNNVATGYYALAYNETGDNNAAFGYDALGNTGKRVTAGSFVTGVSYTIQSIGTTDFTLIGAASNTVGLVFTASGAGTGTGTASSNNGNNVAFGYYGLGDLLTGSNNTSIGHNTGLGITTGSNNTILGANVTGLSSSLSNNIIIADGSGNQRINVDNNGNVGIGDQTPDALFNVDLAAGKQVLFEATAAPTVDMVAITNSGQGTTTNGVDGLSITFVSGDDGGSDTNFGLMVNATSGTEGDSFGAAQFMLNNQSTGGAQAAVTVTNADHAANSNTGALLWLNNLETTADKVGNYLFITTSSTDTAGDAIDVSDSGLYNALNVGDNNIIGTTAVVDFSNFDVSSAGNITVAVDEGLDTNATGALEIGKANATSLDICNSSACDTVNIGNLATDDADTINIGGDLDTVDIVSHEFTRASGLLSIKSTNSNAGLLLQSDGLTTGLTGGGLQLSGGGYDDSADRACITAGATSDCGTFTARSTEASGIAFTDGRITFNTRGSLTIGNTFSFTERMRIDNNGNVGIGDDTTPDDYLDVQFSENASRGVRIENNNAGNAASADLQAINNSGYGASFAKMSSGHAGYKTFAANDALVWNDNNAGNIVIHNDYASGNILFSAGGSSTAQMILTSAGNVGIGDSTPDGKFEVEDTAGSLITVSQASADSFDRARVQIGNAGNGLDQLYVNGRFNTAYQMFFQDFLGNIATLAADGNWGNSSFDEIVGTGGTSPSGSIQIVNTTGVSGAARLTFTGTLGTGPWGSNWGTAGILFTERSLNPVMEARVIASSNTDQRAVVGFTDVAANTTVSADTNLSANEAFFRKTAAGTQWEAVSRAGSGTEQVTTSVGSTSSYQLLRVELDEVNDAVKFYVNNSIVATHSTAVPATSTRLGWNVMNTPTTTTYSGRVVDIDYVRVWSDDPPKSQSNSGLDYELPEEPESPDQDAESLELDIADDEIPDAEDLISDLSEQDPVADEVEATGEESGVLGVSDDQSGNLGSVTIDSATITLDLNVTGMLFANGGLKVAGPSEFMGDAIFNSLVSFIGPSDFTGDANFAGRATFNKDSGGFAVIQTGKQEVKIVFDRPYADVPVVTLTNKNGQFIDYAYKDLTKDGFTIILKDPAVADVEMSWTALSVKQAKVTVSP